MASTYLTRTPSSAGNRKTYTFAGWFKRSNITDANILFEARIDNDNRFDFRFGDNEKLLIYGEISNSNVVYLETNAVYRDPSAWYHIVVTVDTTQSTQSDRVKVYVNGEQVTSFATSTNTLSQDQDTPVNSTNVHSIGANTTGGAAFDGYAAHVHFTDGYAYAASTFGSTATNGQWVPNLNPSVTYGTNGYFLKFTNASDLGEDFSGNNNDYTKSGNGDQVKDSPENVYCTLNPLFKYPITVGDKSTLTKGNLESTSPGENEETGGTLGVGAGKWYFEVRAGNNVTTSSTDGIGFYVNQQAYDPPNNLKELIYRTDGNFRYNGSQGAYGATWTAGDIIGIALDITNTSITFYKNGTTQGVAKSDIPAGTYLPFILNRGNNTTLNSNFGQDGTFGGNVTAQGNSDANGEGDFYYSVPTGFLALCSNNLSSSLTQPIGKGSSHFNPVLWTGNGADDRSITGVGFQPDAVWWKERNSAVSHRWVDAVRGPTKLLFPNSSDDEFTDANELQAFESDGFQIGSDGSINGSSDTYVGWCWKGSNSTASNTDGSTTSTVSVNTTSGFSIVTYTGTGSTATVGHGLGAIPRMVVTKARDDQPSHFQVYHVGLTSYDYYVRLNETSSQATGSGMSNDPTSTLLRLSSSSQRNQNGIDYVGYCFKEVIGYSKFNYYNGNGSTDGTFVYTGFRPSFFMTKPMSTTGEWTMYDNKRDTFNVADRRLIANDSASEYNNGNGLIDFLSNGFKMRVNHPSNNSDGVTYIYMAFAENPFVDSSGIPVTAR